MMLGMEKTRSGGAFGCLALIAVLVPLLGCSSRPEAGQPPHDGRYDSSFPYSDAATVLERVVPSVQMITAIVYYKAYSIPESDSLEASELLPGALERYASVAQYVNTTQVGTAIILSVTDREALVLTCAHVVVFPETVLAYHHTPSGTRTPLLSSIAIQERSSAAVAMLPDGGDMEVLASDGDLDVAILGTHYAQPPRFSVSAFPYPFGTEGNLDWGTFVYVFGYPRGQLMVTHGLVSLSRRIGGDGFLIDAGMGRGFSGGPVLAIRDGVPNVEFVGMARMMPGQTSYVLTPELDDDEVDYDPGMPYRGDAFVRRRTEPHYGMAWAIGADAIVAFLERHRSTVARRGYAPVSLTVPKEPHD